MPDSGALTGNEELPYEISDGAGGTDTATLYLTVFEPAPPIADDDINNTLDLLPDYLRFLRSNLMSPFYEFRSSRMFPTALLQVNRLWPVQGSQRNSPPSQISTVSGSHSTISATDPVVHRGPEPHARAAASPLSRAQGTQPPCASGPNPESVLLAGIRRKRDAAGSRRVQAAQDRG